MKIFLLSKTIFIIRTNYNLNTAIMSFTLIPSPSPIRKQEYIFFNVPPKREKKRNHPILPPTPLPFTTRKSPSPRALTPSAAPPRNSFQLRARNYKVIAELLPAEVKPFEEEAWIHPRINSSKKWQ